MSCDRPAQDVAAIGIEGDLQLAPRAGSRRVDGSGRTEVDECRDLVSRDGRTIHGHGHDAIGLQAQLRRGDGVRSGPDLRRADEALGRDRAGFVSDLASKDQRVLDSPFAQKLGELRGEGRARSQPRVRARIEIVHRGPHAVHIIDVKGPVSVAELFARFVRDLELVDVLGAVPAQGGIRDADFAAEEVVHQPRGVTDCLRDQELGVGLIAHVVEAHLVVVIHLEEVRGRMDDGSGRVAHFEIDVEHGRVPRVIALSLQTDASGRRRVERGQVRLPQCRVGVIMNG